MKLIYKVALVFALFIISCGGGDDSSSPMPEQIVPDPQATSLIFPEDNTECNEGVIVNEQSSRVTFRWNASDNTDRYEVNIRNLNTNQNSVITASDVQADITIIRGSPYEWFVVSTATGTTVTASSAMFRFYNQGPGIENYAPFPAEVMSPSRGSDLMNTGGSVALAWEGTDIDNDIVNYEVFFGTSETPTESLGTTSESTLNATVTVETVYYWRVVSIDSQGNSSQSEIFEFKVTS